MPIKIDNREFEDFQSAVEHVRRTRPKIQNPEAYVGAIEKIHKAKLRLAGIKNEANDYEVESMMNRVKSPLSDKVPYGKENRTPKKIRDDSLDRAVDEGLAISSGTKLRPKKPTQADRRRIISARQEEPTSRFNKRTPLITEVPFGKRPTQKESDSDVMNRELAEKFRTENPKSKIKPFRPKGRDFARIISAKQRISELQEKINEERIAKEHNHSIVFRGYKNDNFKKASLETQSGKFAKYWLLNAKQTNGNGWGIAAHTAKENMKKFIGRPLVVTAQSWHGQSEYGESFEHPYLPTNDMNKIFAHQEKFRVGSIVDVFEDNSGDWYANIEMLPKFAGMNLPPFCSPAIYQLDASEHEGNISKWEALHLAALNENPAYGARIALLKGTCIGTANSCTIQFKGAKQLTADFIDDVGLGVDRFIPERQREKRRLEHGKFINKHLKDNILDDEFKNKKFNLSYQQQNKAVGDYIETNEKINPKKYTGGKYITTNLKRRLAGLNKRFFPDAPKPKEEDDEDRYDEIKENRERRFKIEVDRHIMKGKLEKLAGMFDVKREPTRIEKVIPFKIKKREINPYTKKEQEYIQFEPEEAAYIEGNTEKIMPKKQDFSSDVKRRYAKETDIVCPKKLRERLSKLKKASLGEQNMTYQKSKHMKILKKKNPEVRKAQNDVEDILRKQGRSVDASHHQSTFLSTKGDFIGGGDIHDIQIRNILDPSGAYGETVTNNFLKKHGLVRVQRFPINRAGDKKISVGINSKINPNQLKAIQELEKGGNVVGFAVGTNDKSAVTGEGFSNLVKTLRENKFL